MKTSSQSFPYPMLTSADAGNDYVDGSFECGLNFQNELDKDDNIVIDYICMLSVDELSDLIERALAKYCVEVTCSDTLFRKFFPLKVSGQLRLDAKLFHGRVDFTPMVISKAAVLSFASVDFNAEYGDQAFNLCAGDILATDITITKYIEFNQLAFDTLVKIRTNENLDPFAYSIDPTPKYLYITMGTDIRSLWGQVGKNKEKQSYFAMSIYKDCLFMAVEQIIANEHIEDQQWARALKSKIADLGIILPAEVDFNEVNIIAQRLVQNVGIARIKKLGV